MEDNTSEKITPSGKFSRGNFRSIMIDRFKLCAIIFVIYVFLNIFNYGCPIKGFSGISCPGCGMTRAVLSVLQFHFHDAFYYHPLFFLTPFMFLLFLFEHYIPVRFLKIAWSLIILAFFVTYLYRIILIPNEIVTFDPHSGFLWRAFHYLFG